jgi:sugar lactone lactonase YvrE
MARSPEVLLDQLYFPEGPRWRTSASGDGKLWFSDMLAGAVMTVDLQGHSETLAEVPQLPSGLGRWPDGRLVVVSVGDGKLMSIGDSGELTQVADMQALDGLGCNDMVVDAQGRSYIGSFGTLDEDRHPGPGNMPQFSNIILVEPDGNARIVAERMTFPNGAAISPDGRTYIVAETFANRRQSVLFSS